MCFYYSLNEIIRVLLKVFRNFYQRVMDFSFGFDQRMAQAATTFSTSRVVEMDLFCDETLSISSTENSKPASPVRCVLIKTVKSQDTQPQAGQQIALDEKLEACYDELCMENFDKLSVEEPDAMFRVPSPVMISPAGVDGPQVQVTHVFRFKLGGIIWLILKFLHTHRK